MCLETRSLRTYSHKISNNRRSPSIFQASIKLAQGNQLSHLRMPTKISSNLLDHQYHLLKPSHLTSLASRIQILFPHFSRVLRSQTLIHQPLLIFSSLRIMHFSSQHKTNLLRQPSFKLRLLPLTHSPILPKYQCLVNSSNHSLLNLVLLLLQLLDSHRVPLSQVSRQANKLINQVYQTFSASSLVRFKQVITLYRSSTNSNRQEH